MQRKARISLQLRVTYSYLHYLNIIISTSVNIGINANNYILIIQSC